MTKYHKTWRTTPYGGKLAHNGAWGAFWLIVGMTGTLIALIGFLWLYTKQQHLTLPPDTSTRLHAPPVLQKKHLTIQEQITLYTKNVPDNTALRIAQCESQFGKYNDNPTSTATGLYQFTITTWEHYCSGNIHDPLAQIQCFDELYPQHPTWWECA